MTMTYSEQLRHPNWQRRRLEIMQRDEFKCACCRDSETTLHVHHKHYFKGRMAWEYSDDELVTLCESCHEVMHERDDRIKMLFAHLNIDGPYSIGDGVALLAGWAHQNCGTDLADYYRESPSNFVLGEVADILDVWDFDLLTELRDALHSAPLEQRKEALRAMVQALKEVA